MITILAMYIHTTARIAVNDLVRKFAIELVSAVNYNIRRRRCGRASYW